MKNKVELTATPEGVSDKNHLIAVLAGQTGSSKAAAQAALDAVLETVALSLRQNNRVQLLGFGTFEVSERGPRKGVNPRTGEPLDIGPSKTVRFRPSASLKGSL